MKILAAGDSFTYGEELSDVNNAWPFLLARQANASIVNLAEPAASNDKITRKTIDYIVRNPGNIDLVVIGWSSPGRMEFADEHGYYDVWPGYSGNLFIKDNASWRNEICKYISVYHDRKYLYYKYLQQVVLMQSFLKANNIRYAMIDVLAFDYYKNNHHDNPTPYFDQINKEYFIGFNSEGMMEITYKMPQGPNGHFLDEGHAAVAKKFYEHIRNLGWLS